MRFSVSSSRLPNLCLLSSLASQIPVLEVHGLMLRGEQWKLERKEGPR